MTARAAGMSLIELVVALTVLSVGVLGLAGAATFAQRSFNDADAIERGVHAAAAVLDSLMRVAEPAAGERAMAGTELAWTVAGSTNALRITLNVHVDSGARGHPLTFHAVHSGRLAR